MLQFKYFVKEITNFVLMPVIIALCVFFSAVYDVSFRRVFLIIYLTNIAKTFAIEDKIYFILLDRVNSVGGFIGQLG